MLRVWFFVFSYNYFFRIPSHSAVSTKRLHELVSFNSIKAMFLRLLFFPLFCWNFESYSTIINLFGFLVFKASPSPWYSSVLNLLIICLCLCKRDVVSAFKVWLISL